MDNHQFENANYYNKVVEWVVDQSILIKKF